MKLDVDAIRENAINAINRYYNIPEYDMLESACNMCSLIHPSSCEDCPFAKIIDSACLRCCDLHTLRDAIGAHSRLGAKYSNKSLWQQELFNRYNAWALKNNLELLTWEK